MVVLIKINQGIARSKNKLLGHIKELKNKEKHGEFVLVEKVLKKYLYFVQERKQTQENKLKMY
jgi:hypothetical protein